MVGLSLFVVGLFSLVAHNLHLALRNVEERVEIVAFLRDDAPAERIEVVKKQISESPEVRNVRLVSKEEALEIALRDLPEISEISSGLDVNPFPASLEIELAEESRTPAILEKLATEVSVHSIVEDVRYGREWVENLFSLRRIGALATAGLGVAFAGVAALIIGTAIRIAVFARREEIHIMRLVGARDSFIRRPFLLEGAITGVLGGLLALLFTWGAYRLSLQFLFPLVWIPRFWIYIGLTAGCAFGLFSSKIAIKRYLREV